jgi:hypothetical protein
MWSAFSNMIGYGNHHENNNNPWVAPPRPRNITSDSMRIIDGFTMIPANVMSDEEPTQTKFLQNLFRQVQAEKNRKKK